MKYWFAGIVTLLFLPVFLAAEVGVLSLTSEDVHTKKEDFWHTFEYYVVGPSGKTTKCQATRIEKKWFATAAHCVAALCTNNCTLRMDLLEQPYSAFVSVSHSAKKPVVFIHPGYNASRPVDHDFALLNIDLNKADVRYYRRPAGAEKQNVAVSKAMFNRFLQRNTTVRREFNSILHPSFPPLLYITGGTGRLNRELSVISIFGGKRQILKNPNPTDYVEKLGFAYTPNFGIREGMSGSGVMANTGELVGVVSAYLGIWVGKKKEEEYFMFAVFDGDILNFMERVMGSDYYKLDRKEADSSYIGKASFNHSDVINAVDEIKKASVKNKTSK